MVEYPNNKKRVLIVDDDEDVRMVMRFLLEKEAYEVVEAEDGEQGLNAVFNSAPDAVLCDLAMPLVDGREFVATVRGHKVHYELPIVMFTAFSDEKNKAELLELGASDFIAKTAGPKVIIESLDRLMT